MKAHIRFLIYLVICARCLAEETTTNSSATETSSDEPTTQPEPVSVNITSSTEINATESSSTESTPSTSSTTLSTEAPGNSSAFLTTSKPDTQNVSYKSLAEFANKTQVEFSVNVTDCPKEDMNYYIYQTEDLITERDKLRMEFQEIGIQRTVDIHNFTKLHDELEAYEKRVAENQTCILKLEARNILFWRKSLRQYRLKKLFKLKTDLTRQRDIFFVEGLKQFRDMNRLMQLYNQIIDMAIEADDAEQGLNIRQLLEAF